MITRMMFLLFFVLISFRCSNEGYNKFEQEKFLSRLDSLIILIQKEEIRNEIKIRDLTEIEWEQFYFFPAYSSKREIDQKIGFKWNNTVIKKIENYDDNDLAVFIRKNIVVLYILLPRQNLIFEPSTNSDELLGLTPDNAKFRVEFSGYKNLLKLTQ